MEIRWNFSRSSTRSRHRHQPASRTIVRFSRSVGLASAAFVLLALPAAPVAAQQGDADRALVHQSPDPLLRSFAWRSIGLVDQGGRVNEITPLQRLTSEVTAAEAHLFEPRDAVLWMSDRTLSRSVTGDKNWVGWNAPESTAIAYYLGEDTSEDVTLRITDLRIGETFRDLEATREAGLNQDQWNLWGHPPEDESGGGGFRFRRRRAPLAEPGLYRVTLSVDRTETTRTVRVREDVWWSGNIG